MKAKSQGRVAAGRARWAGVPPAERSRILRAASLCRKGIVPAPPVMVTLEQAIGTLRYHLSMSLAPDVDYLSTQLSVIETSLASAPQIVGKPAKRKYVRRCVDSAVMPACDALIPSKPIEGANQPDTPADPVYPNLCPRLPLMLTYTPLLPTVSEIWAAARRHRK